MPRKIMLRMYAGVTKKGKNTKVSTVLARNRIEAKRKMRKNMGQEPKWCHSVKTFTVAEEQDGVETVGG